MADFFVKSGGSATAPYDTWAKATSSIATALAAVTGAGDRVIVAPGVYSGALSSPAYSGSQESHRCYLIGDCSGTVADGGSNYHGVTAGPVTITATPSPANPVVNWNTAKWWTMRGVRVSVATFNGTDYRAMHVGDGTNNRGEGCRFEDCIFVGNHFGANVYNNCSDTSKAIAFVRCIFLAGTNYVSNGKGTANNATPETLYYNCLFVANGLEYGSGFLQQAYVASDGSSYYAHVGFYNCTFAGRNSGQYSIAVSNTTYGDVTLIRCLSINQDFSNTTTGFTVEDSHFLNAAQGSGAGTVIDTDSAQWPSILCGIPDVGSTLLAINTTNTPTGDDQVYDLLGNSHTDPGVIGCLAISTKRTQLRTSETVKGVTTMMDYPDVGNVTEDDTVNGSTGTYHEPTVDEVQDGVMFGAGSALEGTYAGGGTGGYVHRHVSVGIGVK